MKELTIEQKAKAYDNVREKIAIRFGSNVADEIFSEYEESEDERIRKEIMDFIDTKTIDSDERRNRWFSYLEKHKPVSFTSLEDTKIKMSLIRYISELNQDVVHLHPGIETCNDWIAWLEKQGEQALPFINERAWLYLVADVLTWKDGIGQYLDGPRVQKLAQKLCSEYSQKLYNSSITKQEPAEKKELKSIDNYCRENCKGFQETGKCFFDDKCEAYKTYKQKSADNVEPKSHEDELDVEKKMELTEHESEEELSDFEAALFSAFSDGWQQYLNGEEVDFAQWAREHSAELLEAANQNRIAWSEEDEKILNDIDVTLFEEKSIPNAKYRKFMNWLKSLKQRIGE